jgi:hypothetical protein
MYLDKKVTPDPDDITGLLEVTETKGLTMTWMNLLSAWVVNKCFVLAWTFFQVQTTLL